MKQWKICCMTYLFFLFYCFGCASHQVKSGTEQEDDIEERIEVLSAKLAETLRNRDFATANLAIIEESSIGKRTVSQFGTFVTDRLRQQLTRKNFSIVDIKGAHWMKILNNKPIETPETDCERKESPDVILLLNVKDYGPSSKNIYVSVTGKQTDSNRFIEGLMVEEQFYRSGRIVSWLKDTKPVTLPLGTESNPFKIVDNGAEYLANTVCCPYREVVRKWERGELGLQNINPEDITLVVMAVNSRTRKMGRFEQLIMQKIKSYLIKNCRIENAVDFSDYGLIDRQLSFYEKEGTFKLDFTASNRERFKPGTVLLIAETFYRDNSKVDVMVRASWMKGRAETVAGDRRSVGGTYLPGFASNACFNWAHDKSNNTASETAARFNDKVWSITMQMVKGYKPKTLSRIAVADLSTLDGKPCLLGELIAEKITTYLQQSGDFTLVERNHLKRVMDENNIARSKLFDKETSNRIGKLLGAEAIVIGTVTDMGGFVDANTRLINCENGEILSTASTIIEKTKSIASMIEPAVNLPAPPPAGEYRVVFEELTVLEQPVPQVDPDFNIDIWTDRVKYRMGDKISFYCRANRDCYLTLIDIGSGGNITILFPNRYVQTNMIRANTIYRIPSDNYDNFEFVVEGPTGLERIKAIASLTPLEIQHYQFQKYAFRSITPKDTGGTRDIGVYVKELKKSVWVEDSLTILIK